MAAGSISEKGADWLVAANKMYNSPHDLNKNYRKEIDKSRILGNTRTTDGKEQVWVDKYFTPLIELITSQIIWKCMAQFTEMYGLDRRVGQRSINHTGKCQAHFSRHGRGEDVSGHWNSRKPGDKKWFDPYTEYQPLGSNQFCGVFSMMYLLDKLPEVSADSSFHRYYIYSNAALMFCKEVIDLCIKGPKKVYGKTREQWLILANHAIKNSNAFINVVEIDERTA
jgi:hypothetical protein